MSFVLADRVKETCSAPGTGTVTLLGAATGYQSFSAGIGASNTTYYTIADQGGANWEVGYGTIGAGGTTLARTTVLASSNSGSLVNFSSGSQDVFCDYAAGKAVFQDISGEITGTTINANTKFVSENYYAQSILGGNLRTSGGTSLLNWDGGGSGNVTVNGGLTASPANKNVAFSPSGTGTVTVNPATTGAMDNMVIGATTPKAITGTTVTATSFVGSGASLTSIPNSALVNSAITINGTSTSLGGSISVGTVTSVSGTAPVVSSGGATPAISMAAANTTTNGYLTSTDWNTFNGKAPAVTYTTNYIPFGQGTTTPNQSANLQWDGSTLRAGSNALLGGTTNPILGVTGSANNYIQGYIYNANAGTSTSSDFVAYTNNSTDAHGWADMGFTSSVYADTTYTVTGPNEAYLFGSAPSGSGKTGNLVYATDSTGTENVHQFYVGGFTQAKTAWKAKIDSTGLKATQVNATNGIIANSKTISASYTVASGDNAMSTGPVTVASGQSVTVASGSRWVVL